MSFGDMLREDRRGVILCALDEAGAFRLAEGTVKSVLGSFGHNVSAAEVRGDLDWLDKQGLLRLERAPLASGAELWTAQLLEAGQDVARGVRHPGVKQQAPKR